MSCVVRRIANEAEREACYLVRMKVFVEEQAVPPWEEMDAFDETAIHFGVFDGARVVGTARLVALSPGMEKVGRVCLLAGSRRSGIGKQLMEHVIADAFSRVELVMLDSQVDVVGFYEKLGFIANGPVFLDAGIEHRRMTLRRAHSGIAVE